MTLRMFQSLSGLITPVTNLRDKAVSSWVSKGRAASLDLESQDDQHLSGRLP